MPRTLSVVEEIRSPADHVWAALTDWTNAHRWMPGVEAMSADGVTATGTKLTFRARRAQRTSTIVECEPGRLIVLRSVQGGVTADYRYAIEDLDGRSCRMTLVADCRFSGLVFGLASPLLKVAIRISDGKQLRLLKAFIEDG